LWERSSALLSEGLVEKRENCGVAVKIVHVCVGIALVSSDSLSGQLVNNLLISAAQMPKYRAGTKVCTNWNLVPDARWIL
jgi:hypothetical protein